MSLSALSLSGFAGGITGITSGLLFSFQGGLRFCSFRMRRFAGLVFGFQGGFMRRGLGGFCGECSAAIGMRRRRQSG
jgi:hypothetical protein